MRVHSASYLGYTLEVREPTVGSVTVRLIENDTTFRLSESFVDAEHARTRARDAAFSRRRASVPKESFLGWGFEGGFFTGGVAGSLPGRIGFAVIFVGVFKAYGELGRAGLTDQHRTNLLVVGFAFAAIALLCLLGGYNYYCDQCDERFFGQNNWKRDAPEWTIAETTAK